MTAALRVWIDAHAIALWIALSACAWSVPLIARWRFALAHRARAGTACGAGRALIAAVGAMLVFAVFASVRNDPQFVGPLDRSLALLSGALHPHVLDGLALVTQLGDPGWLAGVAIFGAAWLVVRGRSRFAVIGLLTVAANGVLVRAFKFIFERPRPPSGAWLIEPGWSFPSGHAASAFMVYGACAWFASRMLGTQNGRRLAAALALLVALIGSSRVLLGVHYASDVLAGFALGAAHLAIMVAIIAATGGDGVRERPRPGVDGLLK